jgi:hypothetical protein
MKTDRAERLRVTFKGSAYGAARALPKAMKTGDADENFANLVTKPRPAPVFQPDFQAAKYGRSYFPG